MHAKHHPHTQVANILLIQSSFRGHTSKILVNNKELLFPDTITDSVLHCGTHMSANGQHSFGNETEMDNRFSILMSIYNLSLSLSLSSLLILNSDHYMLAKTNTNYGFLEKNKDMI